MSKVLLIICVGLALTVSIFSQEQPFRPSVSTIAPNNMRHEIIQAKFQSWNITLRLDKYTGRVFNLTACPQRSFIGTGPCWKETTVIELPKPGNDNAVKFQIFAQGEGGKSLMLINNITGQTWQLILEEQIYKWIPFLDTIPLPQSFEIIR